MDVLPLIPVAYKAARYVWLHGANDELEDLESEAAVGLLVLNRKGKLDSHPNPEALTFQACRYWLLDKIRSRIEKLNGYRVVLSRATQGRIDPTTEYKFLVCEIKTANPKQVLVLRGLYEKRTSAEIGSELKMSASRVRQIVTEIRTLNRSVQ